MKKKYFVQWGVNEYHIIHTKAFDFLRDAKEFIADSTPKAYKLTSQDFKSDWSVGENERIIRRSIRGEE